MKTSNESKTLPEHELHGDHFHIFMLVKTTRAWLDLGNDARLKFVKEEMHPLLTRCPDIKLRYFEPEAFSAEVSDILVWETTSLKSWTWLCDHLRETLFWDHFFEIKSILPSIEANYLEMIKSD